MPLHAEFLADDAAAALGSTAPAVYGQRPATVLGASLVLALALMTFLRWTGDAASALEKAVPQPFPGEVTTGSPRVDLTAPDPGDNPP